MDNKTAVTLQKATHKEVQATRRLMRFLEDKEHAGNEVAAFDSMQAQHQNGREAANSELPDSLQRMFANEFMKENRQAAFDGIADGIEEYKRRNGGDMPSAHVVAAALSIASLPFGGVEMQNDEHATFDSLSLGHHESLSVVPAATQVIIAYGISNALPIVSMLPNPMGSNELPIVYGTATAGIDMGVMRKGDLMDGNQAGMPYLENRHTLLMEQDALTLPTFAITSHVAYTAEVRPDNTVKFIVDKTSIKAPFLGGRISVMVKGVEIANDKNRQHATVTGRSSLQALDSEPLKIGANTYVFASGYADLDEHVVTVTFDTTAGAQPAAEDVTVELIFDYERRDANDVQILREPSTDLTFLHRSIYAHPSRSKSVATIDAITQLANELGLNWYAAAQTIAMQRYYFEQYGRLMRAAMNMCLSNQDPTTGRVVTYDFVTNGIAPTSIAGASSKINITLGLARSRLSSAINMPIAGYDIYVSARGAAFFSGLDSDSYEPTDASYGDNYSIYRVGRLKTGGANVYFVPDSMGVFNDTAASTTAHALLVPRTTIPAQAPFVGMIAVPPMVLTSSGEVFRKDVGIYSRMAAELNPVPRFANQFMLIEMINLPAL